MSSKDDSWTVEELRAKAQSNAVGAESVSGSRQVVAGVCSGLMLACAEICERLERIEKFLHAELQGRIDG